MCHYVKLQLAEQEQNYFQKGEEGEQFIKPRWISVMCKKYTEFFVHTSNIKIISTPIFYDCFQKMEVGKYALWHFPQ